MDWDLWQVNSVDNSQRRSREGRLLRVRDLFVCIFFAATVGAAGGGSGVFIFLPVAGVAAIYLSAVTQIQRYFVNVEQLRKATIFVFLAAIILPCVDIPVIVDAEPARLTGCDCMFFSGAYLATTASSSYTKLDMLCLSKAFFSFSILCSAVTPLSCVPSVAIIQKYRVLKILTSISGIGLIGTWIAPVMFEHSSMNLGFLCWAFSVNCSRFAMTFTWLDFCMYYTIVLVVLIGIS